MALVFDIETNGLLDTLTTIHSLVIYDTETKKIHNCYDASPITFNIRDDMTIKQGLQFLADYEGEIAGHNIIKFDIPAIQKVYPSFKPKGKIFDTLIASKLIYPDIADIDYREMSRRRYHLPKNLIGKYSLKAFGYRLNELKGDYNEQEDCWAKWTPEMQRYCEQDVVVTQKLFERLKSKEYSQEALDLEQRFAEIISRQEQIGVCFDVEKAQELDSTLRQRKYELESDLKRLFPPLVQTETFIPSRPNKTLGYTGRWQKYEGQGFYVKKTGKEIPKNYTLYNEYDPIEALETIKYSHIGYGKVIKKRFIGDPFTKKTIIEFNPSSRQMVSDRLIRKYGWRPKEKSPTGLPKIDETVLSTLPYPEAPLLTEYFTLSKVLGYLSEGKNAWLKLKRDQRLHGSVDSLGTVSRRGKHSHPNLGNIPAISKDKQGNILYNFDGGWGYECRELFKATPGMVMVGADLAGLELRCLAHYMNDPEYTKEVISGDPHTKNQLAAGLPTRSDGKRFIYAFLYGGGDQLIGELVGGGAKEGKKIKQQFLDQIPSLNRLITAVKKKAKEKGYILSIDKQKLKVRGDYLALNLLLQNLGALVAKKSRIILEDLLAETGWVYGTDYAQILWVHDEYQFESRPEIADELGKLIVKSFELAGEAYNLRCPITGEYKVGRNWAETH